MTLKIKAFTTFSCLLCTDGSIRSAFHPFFLAQKVKVELSAIRWQQDSFK